MTILRNNFEQLRIFYWSSTYLLKQRR